MTWAASDGDGDALAYVIQHSADDGETWVPVAVGLTQTHHTVDLALLPGSHECLLRVAANDGFYTSYDTVDATFTLPRKAAGGDHVRSAGRRFLP